MCWKMVLNFRRVYRGRKGDPWAGSGLVSSHSKHLAPIFYYLIRARTNTGWKTNVCRVEEKICFPASVCQCHMSQGWVSKSGCFWPLMVFGRKREGWGVRKYRSIRFPKVTYVFFKTLSFCVVEPSTNDGETFWIWVLIVRRPTLCQYDRPYR